MLSNPCPLFAKNLLDNCLCLLVDFFHGRAAVYLSDLSKGLVVLNDGHGRLLVRGESLLDALNIVIFATARFPAFEKTVKHYFFGRRKEKDH